MRAECTRCGKFRPVVNKKRQCVDCEMAIADEREQRRKQWDREYYLRNRETIQRKSLARYRRKHHVA